MFDVFKAVRFSSIFTVLILSACGGSSSGNGLVPDDRGSNNGGATATPAPNGGATPSTEPTIDPNATPIPSETDDPGTGDPSVPVTPSPTPSSSPTATPTPTPTPIVGSLLGGDISGLSQGSSMTLQELSSGVTVDVESDGSFVFPRGYSVGDNFEVVVQIQPSAQSCTVTNDRGVFAEEDIADVTVACLGGQGYGIQLVSFQTADPSLIVSGFRVSDIASGAPITTLSADDFSVLENGAVVGEESFLDVEAIPSELVALKTVLLIDVSQSIDAAEMADLKEAAKEAMYEVDEDNNKISRLLEGQQQVAIFTFDSEVKLLQRFTDDLDLLESAIDSIPEDVLARSVSTNLLDAVVAGVLQWNDSVDLSRLEFGYTVLLTDGDHNFDSRTPADIEAILENQFEFPKAVFAVAVGVEDPTDTSNSRINTLNQLTGTLDQIYAIDGFEDPQQLVDVFDAITASAQAKVSGLYRAIYATPKRVDQNTVSIELVDNNACENGVGCPEVRAVFSADGYSDIRPTLFVELEGGEALDIGGHFYDAGEFMVISAELSWVNLTPELGLQMTNLVGAEPSVTELSPSRWSVQFTEGFVSASFEVTDTVTGENAVVTVTGESGHVYALSDSSFSDYLPTVELGSLDCSDLNPSRVYIRGSFTQAETGLDAIVDTASLNDFCVGFDDHNESVPALVTSDGRYIYINGDLDNAEIYELQQDPYEFSFVAKGNVYPAMPLDNDTLMSTATCTVEDVALSPVDDTLFYTCSDTNMINTVIGEYATHPGGRLIGVGGDGTLIFGDIASSEFHLLATDLSIATIDFPDQITNMYQSRAFIDANTGNSSVWIAVHDGDEFSRWSVDLVTQMLVENGAFVSERNDFTSMTAPQLVKLDSGGRLIVAGTLENFAQVVALRPIQGGGDFSIIYGDETAVGLGSTALVKVDAISTGF